MEVLSKGELALLYMPKATVPVARAYLSSWIKHNEALKNELKATGYSPNAKLLTPKQIKIIFHHLGEP